MNEGLRKIALPGLRWALALVLVWESAQFAFGKSAEHLFARTGLPYWIRPVLGGAEVVAALLFLVPAASLAGGYALLMIFFFAAVIHILHGWYDVGALVIYAMTVLACMAHRDAKPAGGAT